MKMIFGLGNPGTKYVKTYHNLGFLAIDDICVALGVKLDKSGHNSQYAQFNYKGEKVFLVKPTTYMNASGLCVSDFANYFKCDTRDMLVIYDDIDLAKGSIRYRGSGSPGTHNGMRSIVEELGSTDFPRLRVGSMKTNPDIPLIDYVLMNIPKEEYELYIKTLANVKDCAIDFLNGLSTEDLMGKYNGKKVCLE